MPKDEPQAEVESQVVEPEKKLAAAILCAGHELPKADLVIVVESAVVSFRDATEDTPASAERKVKKAGYPSGADVYLRYDPEVKFPTDAAEVLTMGVDVQQNGLGGFAAQAGLLNVGPAHPAFAAANLAWQRGATDIRVVGLADWEKARLQPFFDALPNHPAGPAQVAVSLS